MLLVGRNKSHWDSMSNSWKV